MKILLITIVLLLLGVVSGTVLISTEYKDEQCSESELVSGSRTIVYDLKSGSCIDGGVSSSKVTNKGDSFEICAYDAGKCKGNKQCQEIKSGQCAMGDAGLYVKYEFYGSASSVALCSFLFVSSVFVALAF